MFDKYHVLSIITVTSVAYFFSWILAQRKIITMVRHRALWNIVLLISFLVSGVLGLWLAFSLDQKLSITWYREILWLHVEGGMVMAMIAFFHLLWHIRYYLNIFNRKF